MGKLEFLDALKRAMAGLDPEIQAKTLAYYEQRFVDGVAIGRTETDVAKELDDPKKIAMTLRANTHLKSFEEKKTPASAARVLVAFAGLAIFNLFMLVPAVVYAALLATLYACGLTFYSSGIVITASGLSGANELVLDGPLNHIVMRDDSGRRTRIRDRDNAQTRVSISAEGINIFTEPKPGTDGARRTSVSIDEEVKVSVAENVPLDAAEARKAAAQAEKDAEAATRASEDADTEADAAAEASDDSDTRRSTRIVKRAESVADNGIVISTDMDDESRAAQTVIGFALVLGGIILLLLSLVVTKYTIIGIKRYVQMNVSLLKGN